MRSLSLLLGAVCALASALPLTHARNSYIRAHWLASESAAAPDTMHRINMALTQRNVKELQARVARVSDPAHEQYGQYASAEEIADLIAPSDEDLDALEDLLYKHGAVDVDIVASRDFASVLLPVSAIHSLYSAADGSPLDLRVHSHAHSGRQLLRVRHGESGVVPRHELLRRLVQLPSGLADFFDYPKERKMAQEAATRRFRADAFAAKSALVSAPKPRHSRARVSAPAPLTFAQETCTSSAPAFGRLASSHETLAVPFTPYCADGSVTRDAANPCADHQPEVSEFVLTMLPRAYPKRTVRYTRAQLECELKPGAEAVTCLFPAQDIPAYRRTHLTVQVVYADNSVSAVASYGSGLAPSPFITPDAIFNRYSVPLGTHGNGGKSGNSQAVVAFEQQYIDVDGDLRHFVQELSVPAYVPPTIDGENDPSNPGGESTLDIQYIMAMGPGVPTTFMSLSGKGPAKPPGDGAYILEWAMHVSNLTKPPLVTSISYGDTEDGYYTKFGSFTYIERMEVELAKMAARGLTVLAGSGDAGVSNVGEAGNDISDTDATCSPFRPFYPSNSAYVTSVSSTFLSPNSLPVCQSQLPVSSFSGLPIVCDTLGEIAVGVSQGIFWTTGGGFSNRSASGNPTASWQAEAVAQYLNTAVLPPSELFDAQGRGYPDVSTLGHNLLMHIHGNLSVVDGTSASGPVMAGLVSLLNEARLQAGQPPLGFLNPLLYGGPAEAFMSVTVGHNNDGDIQHKCSPYPSTCPAGFKTQTGWTPVTGLGTPNWAVLQQMALQAAGPDAKRTKFD